MYKVTGVKVLDTGIDTVSLEFKTEGFAEGEAAIMAEQGYLVSVEEVGYDS